MAPPAPDFALLNPGYAGREIDTTHA
jgi:hypothetical protein